jgi:glycosyltransferase involved in cell wall biosynthesis
VRIVAVSDLDLVNANYRVYQPMHELSRRGHDLRYNRRGEPRVRLPDALRADVLYVYRFVDEEILAVARRCREEGVAVVWDNDDDLMAVPKSNPRYRLHGGVKAHQMMAGTKRMVQLADVVTTPSPMLAARFRQLGGADVRVVENFVPSVFIQTRPRKHRGVVIGWIAGLEHQVDYQALRLKETFTRLLETYEGLRVHSVGLGLGLPADRYDHVSGAPFLELASIAAAYDIGIAPLADIPFNRSRSNSKIKEYAAAGAPWLASPVGAYSALGAGQGGRLVADADWDEELERLITGVRVRRKLARSSGKWGATQGIERNIGLWEAVLHDACTRRRQ